MIKQLTAIVCLALPLLAVAGEGKEGREQKGKRPVAAASQAKDAATPAVPAQSTPAEERARVAKRGMAMGACQQQAAQQQLDSMARKLFIGKCLKGM